MLDFAGTSETESRFLLLLGGDRRSGMGEVILAVLPLPCFEEDDDKRGLSVLVLLRETLADVFLDFFRDLRLLPLLLLLLSLLESESEEDEEEDEDDDESLTDEEDDERDRFFLECFLPDLSLLATSLELFLPNVASASLAGKLVFLALS